MGRSSREGGIGSRVEAEWEGIGRAPACGRGAEHWGGCSRLDQRGRGGGSSRRVSFKTGAKLSPSSPKGSPQLTQQKCSGCQWVPKAVTIFCGE